MRKKEVIKRVKDEHQMLKRRKQKKQIQKQKEVSYKLDMDIKISISCLLIFPADILSVFLFEICGEGDWLSLLLLLLNFQDCFASLL